MKKLVSIILFPGTNCDKDMEYVYKSLGAETTIVWHKDAKLPKSDLVVIPGGFSYGDYLRSGAIAVNSPIMQSIKDYALNGGYTLGICNGFQILCESKLLPGALKRNTNLHFISKDISLKIQNNDNIFLKGYENQSEITLPVAHADGNYFCDDSTLKALKDNNQILLTYKNDINGSIEQIAGICNKEKNIFGLMPHPERAFDIDNKDGLKMLENLIK